MLVVLSIACGLFLFTYQSTQFNLTGFLLVLFASALSGLRWSAAQKLTQKSRYGTNFSFANAMQLIERKKIETQILRQLSDSY